MLILRILLFFFVVLLNLFFVPLSATPNVETLQQQATVLAWDGDYVGAADMYNQVLSIAPDFVDAHVGLAQLLSWQKQYQEACDYLLRLLKDNPKRIDILLLLGKIHRWQNLFEQSELFLLKALEINSHQADVLFELGFLYYAQNDHAKALRYWDMVLALQPNHALTQKWRSVLLDFNKPIFHSKWAYQETYDLNIEAIDPKKRYFLSSILFDYEQYWFSNLKGSIRFLQTDQTLQNEFGIQYQLLNLRFNYYNAMWANLQLSIHQHRMQDQGSVKALNPTPPIHSIHAKLNKKIGDFTVDLFSAKEYFPLVRGNNTGIFYIDYQGLSITQSLFKTHRIGTLFYHCYYSSYDDTRIYTQAYWLVDFPFIIGQRLQIKPQYKITLNSFRNNIQHYFEIGFRYPLGKWGQVEVLGYQTFETLENQNIDARSIWVQIRIP